MGPYYAIIDGKRVEISAAEHEASLGDPTPFLPVVFVRKLDYFSRMTDAEADTFQEMAATRPYRERAMLDAATQFETTHELWPLLLAMNVQAFGEARAAELLAPSE